MADLTQALRDSAAGPSSVSIDGQQTSQHNLQDQLAVAKFQMATRARTLNRAAGVSFTKLRPHGSVLYGDCPADNRSPTGL